MIDQVIDKCKQLRLKACGHNIAQVIEMATEKNWSTLKTVAYLFDLELEYRRQNRIALCFKKSKLTEKLTVDQFDFHYHRSRKEQKSKILNLTSLEFVQQKKRCHSDWQPGNRQILFGQMYRLRGDASRQKGAVYHCHGYDQPSNCR